MSDKVINLLDQIIERAVEDDARHKSAALAANKASQSIGESWMLFHLKVLKELISNETNTKGE